MSFRTIIPAAALAELMKTKQALLVLDCSFDLSDPAAGEAAYGQEHIPGALHVSLDQDLSAPTDGHNGRHPLPDRHQFASRIAALGLSEGMQVVSYDRSGGFYASRLWWMLRWAGHQNVAVLDGGFTAWREAGLPIEEGKVAPIQGGNFHASPTPLMASVDVAAIEADLGLRQMLVIDARSPQRFEGEPHPLDAAEGHIPGARNWFFQNNLAPDGRFRSADELRQVFNALLVGAPPERVVHQCGSGVTATHNLLAMEIAGLGGSSLYPGSWSEWTSEPGRPIEQGTSQLSR